MTYETDTPQGVMRFCESEGQPFESIQGLLDQISRLRALVDEARPYMESANTDAGPVDDWLARAGSEAI